MQDIVKDIFCGFLSGIGQTLFMGGFPNLMYEMVSQPQHFSRNMQAIIKTLTEEGIRAVFKGTMIMFLNIGSQVALQFGTVQTMKKYMKRTYEPDKQKLSLGYIILSGLLAGLPSALVITPLDHGRFRVALSKEKNTDGSIKTAIKIYKQHGLRKLYLGFIPTLIRQSSMLAIYFTSYEFLMRTLHSQSSPVCLISALLSGGLAGVATFFTNYRIDYLKTLIQTDDLVKPRHTSMFGYYRERVTYYGFHQQIPRAFFVNAAGFFCFEVGKKLVYNQTH